MSDNDIVIAFLPEADGDAGMVCKGLAMLQELVLTGEAREAKHTVMPRRDRKAAEALAAAFGDKPLMVHQRRPEGSAAS